MTRFGRRSFLKTGFLGVTALGSPGLTAGWQAAEPGNYGSRMARDTLPEFKLGMVSWNLGKDWDIETIIKNCEATGFEAVELRTTHKHGVEPSISKAQRAEVRKRFEDSRVRLVSLGSICEYHSAEPAVVRQNIKETRRFAELARDIGAIGVKVRPNGFPPGIPEEKTLEQIGRALIECGDAARNLGVEIWLEVHGQGTQLPKNIRRIMDVCNHPAVGVCWNSNDPDMVDGSVKPSFELLKPWLKSVHINELWRAEYPWRELMSLLRSAGYKRYTFAEIPESCEPIRLMRYYHALWRYHAGL